LNQKWLPENRPSSEQQKQQQHQHHHHQQQQQQKEKQTKEKLKENKCRWYPQQQGGLHL